MSDETRNNKGFTLIETFVAISILAFALVGPLNIAADGIISASYAKDQVTAFYLGQEAIEFIRNIRDTNHLQGFKDSSTWLTGLSLCMSGNSCVIDSINNQIRSSNYCGTSSCPLQISNGAYGYASGWANSIFTREIKIETINANEVSIFVTVKWKTSTLPQRTFQIKETMLNWEP